MITNNKLDKSFGTVGTSAGRFIFIVGLILTPVYLSALILVLLGAFVGFTFSSTLIDYEKKRVRFSNNLFGFIQTGKWLQIEPSMKTGIRKSDQTYRAYSRGDRTLDITESDFRLVLLDSIDKEIMALKKSGSLAEARTELEIVSERLGLSAI